MPDLLLELRSEEIPARMQRKAAGDLRKLVTDALVAAGLTYEGAREYWTPRRLTLDIRGVDARSRDVREERKGPRTDAPEKAIEGFLRGAGLASIAEAERRADGKKGEFFVAVVTKAGRPAEDIVAEIMPGIIRDFPWPKSMRWGAASREPGSLRWVRPLQSILCVFGPENGETVVVPFTVGGIASGDRTVGHRFHAPGEIRVRRFEDYAASLAAAHVVLDAERRKDIIRADAGSLAFAQGLELVEDEALLEEVAGLVEWPVVLLGSFEEAFLAIPPEMIRLTIRANQKCFVTRRPGEAGLSNRFLLVSNIAAADGGAEIARGNGKVVRARLSDALYFWNTDQHDLPDIAALRAGEAVAGLDLAKPLDQRMARLDALGVTFHAKLGTQGERVRRIAALAETLAPLVGADPGLARRASLLAKADLTTEAVGEFPELQGLMGRKYAALQGEPESVGIAIEDHYKPLGPGDRVPTDPVAVAVALADKLDTLVGFFAIDEKPTGSKDPYALRRAALGVIRIILANGLRLRLQSIIDEAYTDVLVNMQNSRQAVYFKEIGPLDGRFSYVTVSFLRSPDLWDRYPLQPVDRDYPINVVSGDEKSSENYVNFTSTIEGKVQRELPSYQKLTSDLLAFFHDRLTVQLRDEGARHDLLDAVLSGGEGGAAKDDLLDVANRVAALGRLVSSEDGRNLLAAYRRAANILAAEEKKGTAVADRVDPAFFVETEEGALFEAVETAEARLGPALASEDYAEAAAALAQLRTPADAFFEKVLVVADDSQVRANRLALLARIREATARVADFSRISG